MASILATYARINRLAVTLFHYDEDLYYNRNLTVGIATRNEFPELAELDLEKSYALYAEEWRSIPNITINSLPMADFIAVKLIEELEAIQAKVALASLSA